MNDLYRIKVGRSTMIVRAITVDGEAWVSVKDLAPRFPAAPVVSKILPDWRGMLAHLMAQHIEHEGQRWPIGAWVRAEARMQPEPDPWRGAGRAGGVLSAYGLKVVGRGDTASLVIANKHPKLSEIFADTEWATWRHAAASVPGATKAGCLSFDNTPSRACKIPFTSIPHFGVKSGG